MPTVIVSGALANKPLNGGNAWSRLSWVRGFERLGYDVHFVEQIDAAACVDAAGRVCPFADSVNLAYFRRVFEQFGPAGRAALLCTPGGESFGPGMDQLARAAGSADLLFNLSGHLTVEALKGGPRTRVYYDDDPGFTQFWHAAGSGAAHLEGHDFYYTIGRNIGSAGCPIPTGGIRWRHTFPPVVLDDWPTMCGGGGDEAARAESARAEAGRAELRFTTVASWRGPYGPVQFGGTTYGLKAHQFRRFLPLPRISGQVFEIALHIEPADEKDRAQLRDNGWRLADPAAAAATPDDFRRYVQQSDAEFSVAQGVYVDTRSGWFSDRTTRYLASGRPALVQDTGFGAHLPAGEGLVSFDSIGEAASKADEIRRHYADHCHAARAVAESHLDSDKVVARLLEEIGLSHRPPAPEGRRR
jgi:hypothetical protein